MKNKYEIRGDITVIFLENQKHGKFETCISTEKLDKAKSVSGRWNIHFNPNNKKFYCVGKIRNDDGKLIYTYLHRWVVECQTGMVVDHIDHNTLDNTDSNLRIVTNAENLQNRQGANKNSKTGVRGVYKDKTSGSYVAVIKINRKRKIIGRFKTIEEASDAVNVARAKFMKYSQDSLHWDETKDMTVHTPRRSSKQSGVRGISWDSHSKAWIVQYKGTRVYPRFKNLDDAKNALNKLKSAN